jgi:hypothetical protein
MEKKKSGFGFAWFLLFFCPGFLFRPAPSPGGFLSESFFLRRKKDGKKGLRVSEKQNLSTFCDTCLEES